jgi:hypothetical protein
MSPDPTVFEVQPTIRRDIVVRARPLPSWGKHFKVLVVLKNRGRETYEDLRVSFAPTEKRAIVNAQQSVSPESPSQGQGASVSSWLAGKGELRVSRLAPGDVEKVTLFLNQPLLDVTINGRLKDQEATETLTKHVRRLVLRRRFTPFRFLRPRRTSNDLVRVEEKVGDKSVAVRRNSQGHFVVCGGQTYSLRVEPEQEVEKLLFETVPADINKNSKPQPDETGRVWHAELEIETDELLSKPLTMTYAVELTRDKTTGDERRLHGDVRLRVLPPRWKHLLFAAKYGGTATGFGALGLVSKFTQAGSSLTQFFANLTLAGDTLWLLALLTVPAMWLGLRLWDAIQYRFRT